MPESPAADKQGNVFGGLLVEMQTLKKYVKQLDQLNLFSAWRQWTLLKVSFCVRCPCPLVSTSTPIALPE
jgi:hypothetical protein